MATPEERAQKKAQRREKGKKRKAPPSGNPVKDKLIQEGQMDAEGFYLPRIPQPQNQNPFDPTKAMKQAGKNQQSILRNTSPRKERTAYGDIKGEKEISNPFKNGYFKPTRDQSASKNFNPEYSKNAVDVAKGEQSNAQKLFASSTPDIQTDIKGNKLANRNGMPVGFSGTPKSARDDVLDTKYLGKPTAELGMTDAEQARNRDSIQNVAANFKPATIVDREYERRKTAGFTPPQNYNPQPVSAIKQSQTPSMDDQINQLPDMSLQPQQQASQGFQLPKINFDPLGLIQPPQPPAPEPYSNPQFTDVRPGITPDYILKALNGGVEPQSSMQNNAVDQALPPLPHYVDDFSNGAPTAQPQAQQPFDQNFWNQFAGVPTAQSTARQEPRQGRFPQAAHPMSPYGQQQNSPEFKARLMADQAALLEGLPFNRRQPKPQQSFVNSF